jgi:predicted transcriptional regulator
LISTVHAALKHAAEGTREPEPLVPPVPINKTIFPDHIISLEDGRRYKYKAAPNGSRTHPRAIPHQVGLAPRYPMVAPNYSKARSELAKALGLGQTRKGKKAGKKRAA